jgi:hypothetical protein
MSFMPIRGRFVNARQAHALIGRIWQQVRPWVEASNGPLRVLVQEDTRTIAQNDHFHDLCDDIAKSGFQWAGKPRTAKQWKVLLVSGHAIATGEGADIIPGLESEFVNIRESTATMSKRRSSSLIEYTLAFMAANDIPRRPNGVGA